MVRLAALLGVIGLAAGCVEKPTQLLVFVDTDFPEGDLDGFGVRVVGPDEEVHDRGSFSLVGEDPVVLPASFGVAPRGGEAGRRVVIEVDAIDQGTVLFTTRARTSFVEGEIVRLDVFLARRCRYEALDCPADQTCGPDGCEPIDVSVEDLGPPSEEPDPPRPSTDWTLWADGTGGSVDTDEQGIAILGLNVAPGGTVQIEEATVDLGSATNAVVARVKPDGDLSWLVELRGTGDNALVGVLGVQATRRVVWVVGAAPDGFVVERDGDATFELTDPATLFVLRMSDDGEVETAVTATTEGALPVYGLALAEDGDLAIGSTAQFPGTFLDASWRPTIEGQALLLRISGDLDTAEACLWAESPSAAYGVAPSGEAVATAGAASGVSLARGVRPGCANPWERFDGTPGSFLSVAGAPRRPLCFLQVTNTSELSLSWFDPTDLDVPLRVPLVLSESWSRLRVEMDPAGRVLASGGATGRIEYDGLSADLAVQGRFSGFLIGTGPGLEGRWIRLVESEAISTVYSTALDPATGAVLFVASGTGEVRFDGVPLGARDGQALVVHRFVP